MWGILSLPIWLYLGFKSSSSAVPYTSLSVSTAEFLSTIFAFPLWISHNIVNSFRIYNTIVTVILSILIGALIGSIIGYFADKLKG